jgi:hypothetical protein
LFFLIKKSGHLVFHLLINKFKKKSKNIYLYIYIDIVLFNSADVLYSADRQNYLIDVHNSGKVTWIFPEKLRSHCSVNIEYFPFDKQVLFVNIIISFILLKNQYNYLGV